MRGVRRRALIRRARQDIAAGSSEIRMVQNVERFGSELNLVAFFVGHAEILVDFSVDAEGSRGEGGVSSDIAELPRRGHDEGGTGVPSVWVWVGDAGTNAG